MAKLSTPIIDLDDLLQNWDGTTEASSSFFYSDDIWIDAARKIFYFKGGNAFTAAGTGVTGQALYSLFKDRWKVTTDLPKFPFPMLSITNEQFEFINGWKPADAIDLGLSGTSDITFNNTGKTIVSAGGVDLSGFVAGDVVVITGSTANDGYYRVASTSNATTITLDSGETLTDAAPDTADIRIYRNAVYQGTGEIPPSTRKMIRTAGWSEVDGTSVDRRYAGVISLGTLGDADQPYYVQDNAFNATTTNTFYTGPVNEAVQFYGNVDYGDTIADDFIGNVGTVTNNAGTTTITASSKTFALSVSDNTHAFEVGDLIKVTGSTNGSTTSNNGLFTVATVPNANSFTVTGTVFDETASSSEITITKVGYNRNDYFKIFVRTRGKSYADADLVDIGVTELTYIVYRFPVSNATDLNINTTNDNAFVGADIATIESDGSAITVTTSEPHGLYVSAPVEIKNTSNYNNTYTVAALDGVTPTTKFTITSTLNVATENTITNGVYLGYVDDIEIDYLVNPDTANDDVVIAGDWANTGVTYALGDVAFDVANSKSNANGARWYYLDATTSAGVPLATANTMNDDTVQTWTLWDPETTYGDGGAEGGQRDIEENDTWSAYSVILDANATGTTPAAPKEVVYEVAQWKLRSTTNINDESFGSVRIGQIADPLVFFVGDTLNTYRDGTVTTPGPFAVVIDDIAAQDVNNIQYNEAISVTRSGSLASTAHRAPTVVTVTFNFNDNLSGDDDSVFYAYYTQGFNNEGNDQTGNDYGTAGAIQVQRTFNGASSNVGSDLATPNKVPSTGQYVFNYAYDSDNANGRATAPNAVDVNITVVAIGLEDGQYISTSGDITRAGGTFSLVAALERNFIDPNG